MDIIMNTFSIPVDRILDAVISDDMFCCHPLINISRCNSKPLLEKTIIKTIDLWIKDNLVSPLDQALFGDNFNGSVCALEDYYSTLADSQSTSMDLMEHVLSHHALTSFIESLEEHSYNRYNLWHVERTPNRIFLTNEGDYRIIHFDKHVTNVSVSQHIETIGLA